MKRKTNGKPPILKSKSGKKIALEKNEAAPRVLHSYEVLISPRGELSLRKLNSARRKAARKGRGRK